MNWEEFKKSRGFKWGREIGFVLLLFLAVTAYQSWDHVSSGEPAPQFDLALLDGDGERVTMESLHGKATLIYFWAPWCGVCEASSDNVTAVREAVGDDYNVLSVALEYESLESVRGFVERNDVGYPVLLGDGETRQDYVVEAFPTIYVLDEEGRVDGSVVGYTTTLGMRARLWWAR